MPLDSLLNKSSGFGQNCNCVFLAICFQFVHFYLAFVVASKIKLIPHLNFHCSHFEWSEIWHADESWPPWELIFMLSHCLLILLILAAFWLSETDQICDFQPFSREHKGGKASNLACWCILTTVRTDQILVTVCWYSSFWRHFDLVEQVKFGVSGIFFRTHGKNGLKFDILMYLDWNWFTFGSWSVGFPHFGTI